MYLVITVLIIVAILLTLIILVQNSKGGGLASNFASTGQMMGVRKTTDFLEKATWTLAGAILVLAFVAVMVIPKEQIGRRSVIDEQLNNISQPVNTMPSFSLPADEDAEAATDTEAAE